MLTDHEIDLMRDLHEHHGLGYSRLAKIFGISRTGVAKICRYENRGQHE